MSAWPRSPCPPVERKESDKLGLENMKYSGKFIKHECLMLLLVYWMQFIAVSKWLRGNLHNIPLCLPLLSRLWMTGQ